MLVTWGRQREGREDTRRMGGGAAKSLPGPGLRRPLTEQGLWLCPLEWPPETLPFRRMPGTQATLHSGTGP